MDDVVYLALRVAVTVASHWRRMGWRGHWRELWGAAWEGGARYLSRGGDRRYLARAMAYAIMDYGRGIVGDSRRCRRSKTPSAMPHEILDALPSSDSTALSDDPLTQWVETRHARRDIPIRQRIWLYLHTVEGWTRDAIARTWGLVPSGVGRLIADPISSKKRGRSA